MVASVENVKLTFTSSSGVGLSRGFAEKDRSPVTEWRVYSLPIPSAHSVSTQARQDPLLCRRQLQVLGTPGTALARSGWRPRLCPGASGPPLHYRGSLALLQHLVSVPCRLELECSYVQMRALLLSAEVSLHLTERGHIKCRVSCPGFVTCISVTPGAAFPYSLLLSSCGW